MIIRLLFLSLLLSSCASINQAGKAYFTPDTKLPKGVLSPGEVLSRQRKDLKLTEIMYGQLKNSRLLACTLLRNQFYVARLHSDQEQIKEAAMIMEQAYQLDDQEFLSACDQVNNMKIGKDFMSIQQKYIQR